MEAAPTLTVIMGALLLLSFTYLGDTTACSEAEAADKCPSKLFHIGTQPAAYENHSDKGLDETAPCRSITVETNKNVYTLSEDVKITVRFIHLLPGCVEIMVLHHHEVRLEVIDERGEVVVSWSWATRGDLSNAVKWRADSPGTYIIRASSWFNGEDLEVMDSETITVVGRDDADVRPFIYGAVCVVAGALLTYFLFKRSNF